MVNWKIVTTPKCWGELGIRDLRVFNKGLLGSWKWLWKFSVEENALWREVIAEKYGVPEGGWRTKNITLPYDRGLRRNTLEGL